MLNREVATGIVPNQAGEPVPAGFPRVLCPGGFFNGHQTRGEMKLEERLAADAPVLERLGIRVGVRDADTLLLHLNVVDNMLNAGGFCHGGLLFALADTACAYALAEKGLTPATVDAGISYLQPALCGDRVTAAASVVKAGRLIGHCEVRLTRGDGRLLATFRASVANVPAKPPA